MSIPSGGGGSRARERPGSLPRLSHRPTHPASHVSSEFPLKRPHEGPPQAGKGVRRSGDAADLKLHRSAGGAIPRHGEGLLPRQQVPPHGAMSETPPAPAPPCGVLPQPARRRAAYAAHGQRQENPEPGKEPRLNAHRCSLREARAIAPHAYPADVRLLPAPQRGHSAAVVRPPRAHGPPRRARAPPKPPQRPQPPARGHWGRPTGQRGRRGGGGGGGRSAPPPRPAAPPPAPAPPPGARPAPAPAGPGPPPTCPTPPSRRSPGCCSPRATCSRPFTLNVLLLRGYSAALVWGP